MASAEAGWMDIRLGWLAFERRQRISFMGGWSDGYYQTYSSPI